MKRAIWMNERDNVVVLIEAFKKNEVCSYTDARGEEHSFVIKEDIPIIRQHFVRYTGENRLSNTGNVSE